uniref:TolC family protein n=1 Tax=Agathobacter sp. TaxID=2021311 RepID=UPI00405600B6
MQINKSKKRRNYIPIILIFSIFMGMLATINTVEAQAAEQTLTLDMAKALGLANSSDYEKLESELSVKEASLKQAIKSIREKKKNMSAFRWSPILSFKFPEQPNLSEEYEFQFKPIQIQAEIDVLEQKLTDQVLAVYEEISNLYIDIVVTEQSVAFNEERLAEMEQTLKQNQLKLAFGQATQSDIASMQKSIQALNGRISGAMGNLENYKKKLSTAIGMDITSGYRFENPLVETQIARSKLEFLIQYTLDRDVSYYEAGMNAATSLISLRTNYDLMENQYGDKMSYISGFVNQAIAGQKVSEKAFKKKYEAFLTAIDEPWQGKKRILFIKIPREWFKGEISGIRYVEDEPYVLYEAVLEYQDALLEKQNMKQSLTEQVEDAFHNLISMRNAYTALEKSVAEAEKELRAEKTLNRLGLMTYEEYRTSLETYEEQQNEMLDALADYSHTLYSFDRLTCGGVTKLLEEAGVDLSSGSGGESFVEEEYADGAYYYIESIIQEEEFRIGVNIPDDFEVEVTHFELWCEDIQIGERVEIDNTIRHLRLALEHISEVKLRFYNKEEFVDDCVIDANSYSGALDIVKSYTVAAAEDLEIGTYTIKNNVLTGMVTIALEPKKSENIAFYLIKDKEGNYLVQSTKIPIKDAFKYLSLLQNSLETMIIEFYGEDEALLYTACFDTTEQKLMKNTEGT